MARTPKLRASALLAAGALAVHQLRYALSYHDAGRVLGARGLRLYRMVILPASLPSLVSGLKQGWAFAWRSLMAGELLVKVAGRPSIGVRLQVARQSSDAAALLATMVVILVIGIAVDAAFNAVDRRVRRNRGLLETQPGG